MAALIEFLMNRTEPSPMRTLTPPGCRLRAPANEKAKGLTFWQGSPSSGMQYPLGRESEVAIAGGLRPGLTAW